MDELVVDTDAVTNVASRLTSLADALAGEPAVADPWFLSQGVFGGDSGAGAAAARLDAYVADARAAAALLVHRLVAAGEVVGDAGAWFNRLEASSALEYE